MYKKAWCTCKVVVLLIKPIVYLTFSLPSASLDLKVPSTVVCGNSPSPITEVKYSTVPSVPISTKMYLYSSEESDGTRYFFVCQTVFLCLSVENRVFLFA